MAERHAKRNSYPMNGKDVVIAGLLLCCWGNAIKSSD